MMSTVRICVYGALVLLSALAILILVFRPHLSVDRAGSRGSIQANTSVIDPITVDEPPTPIDTPSPGHAPRDTLEAAPVTRTLLGRIVTNGEGPIGGVTVSLSGDDTSAKGIPDTGDGLVCVSDDAGRFVLESVPLGPRVLHFRSPDTVALDKPILFPISSQMLDLGVVHLNIGVMLEGVIEDEEGIGVQGAQIYLIEKPLTGLQAKMDHFVRSQSGRASEGVEIATSREKGRFRTLPIRPGPCRLSVVAESFVRLDGEYEARIRGADQNLRITLQHGLGISGTVVAPPGYALDRLRVVATVSSRDRQRSRQTTQTDIETHSASCTAQGDFVIGGFRQDARGQERILTVVSQRGWTESTTSVASARVGDSDVSIHLQPPAWVRFRLIDSVTHQALEKPSVRLDVWVGDQVSKFVPDVEVVPSGDLQHSSRVRVVAGRPEGSTFALRLTHEGYDAVYVNRLTTSPGSIQDIGDLVLNPLPSIQVHVRSTKAQPLTGARITLLRDGADDSERDEVIARTIRGDRRFSCLPRDCTAFSDALGLASLTLLPNTPHKLIISLSGYAGEFLYPIFADAGTISVSLDDEASIEIVASHNGRPLPNVVVYHKGPGVTGMHSPLGRSDDIDIATCNEEGRAQFLGLRAGAHMFLVEGSTSHWTTVQIADHSSTVVTVPR